MEAAALHFFPTPPAHSLTHKCKDPVAAAQAGFKQLKHLLLKSAAQLAAYAVPPEQQQCAANASLPAGGAPRTPYKLTTLHEEARIFLVEGFLTDGAAQRQGRPAPWTLATCRPPRWPASLPLRTRAAAASPALHHWGLLLVLE